ncbi:amidohydrolase family protein [Hydrogenophaga sp. 2FB]|uniref:amidohydrolase family protein n=1 Tax=Hydrogenophaga sp. 2FB TaxID=2502187 RepID=UPI0010F7BB30|nr:amidohydrolase family protein [Hydrogenophaga sp. 2FB]
MKPYVFAAAPSQPGAAPVLGAWHRRPGFEVPAGACDCHVHVFGPRERYPLAADRSFSPGIASVADLLAMHDRIGIERVVVIQASPQGTDNSGVVDALVELRRLGRQARAVAVVAPDASNALLGSLHAAGVRGLRVNLQSYGQTDPALAAARMRACAGQAATMNGHVQTYTTLPVIAALQDTIRQLPVPLVVDHFGLADPALGAQQPGLDALLALVAEGRVWVKLSAPYRLVEHTDGHDGRWLARALIDACPEHMLWGTDWPHTGPWPGRLRELVGEEPFHPVDDGAQLDIFANWTTVAERQQILVDNPQRLYDFALAADSAEEQVSSRGRAPWPQSVA